MYNGWTNRSTWLVNLWIDNEQSTYEYKRQHLLGRVEPVTVKWAQMVGEFFLTATIASKAVTDDGCDLSEIDWGDIAQSWESERLEIHEYDCGTCSECLADQERKATRNHP